MKIVVTTASGEIIELDVCKELELENLKAMCEFRLGIPPSDRCAFKLHERMLTDPKKSLKDYGIKDGDLLQILYDQEKTVNIKIFTASEQMIELDVSKELELENLKAMCELKLGIPLSDKYVFRLHERMLTDPKKRLKDYGIKDGDLLQILSDEEKARILSTEEKEMNITVFTASRQMIELNVSKELELENLKALCECSLGIPHSNRCVFRLHERMLTDPKKSLKDYGITDGDLLQILSDEEMLYNQEQTMNITIFTASKQMIELDVSKELELENLKAMCEFELGIPLSDNCVFRWSFRKLTDPKKSLKDYGILDGDILEIVEEKAMNIIITASEKIIELSVSEGIELEKLKAMCELKLGIHLSDKCVFKLDEKMLTDLKKSLKDYSILDGDILEIHFDDEKEIKIIITISEQIIELSVSDGLQLENLKAICEFKLGIPLSDNCVFIWHDRKLRNPKKCLKDYGIMDGDLLQILPDEDKVVKIIIYKTSDQIIELSVNEGLELEDLKDMCELKLGIPPSKKCFFKWQRRILTNPRKCLKDHGITDGESLRILSDAEYLAHIDWIKAGLEPDLTLDEELDFGNIIVPKDDLCSVERSQAAPEDLVNHDVPHLEDPERIWQMFIEFPDERAVLKERNPPLSEALESGSAERFAEVFNRQQRERFEKEQERLRLLNADPSDPEVLASLKEQERLQKVEENMEVAVEFVPESLCPVSMIYIDCMVNSHPVKAFVDTGAQMTIMNRPCAVRCEIIDLVDLRWAGIAVGVGTQRILGRIHTVDIEINSVVFPSSFSILEDQPVEMILGLDFIKRNMCTIDLSRNVLQIKKANGEVVETPFLSESELPGSARLTLPNRLVLPQAHAESKDQMPAEAFKK